MRLYNTLTRKIEEFKPLDPPHVSYYACGPTVYDYAHIGHMRTYVNNDLLRRVLTYLGYQVKHVMNITDVGHLTDEDRGEDKFEKSAKKHQKTVWQVTKFFTDYFFATMDELNIARPDITAKATDHIEEMINLVKTLAKKGLTYQTDEAVYFDTTKFDDYGKLAGQALEEKLVGAREDVYVDPKKKNPTDFVLWFKRAGRFAGHTMHWPSPWGDGFPGWHIECSAMSMKYLGKTIDIHAGGVDHISVHHTNEIAQSEASTGKPFVRYWFHNEHLLVEGKKMSKSLGNYYTIDDIKEAGVEPMGIRYLFLQSHYRQQMNFTWDSAKAAQEGYKKIKEAVLTLKEQSQPIPSSYNKLNKIDVFRRQFNHALRSDLNLPKAVSIFWQVIKSSLSSTDKLALVLDFDQVLGLDLTKVKEEKIPANVIKLAEERKKARQKEDFDKADRLRQQIRKLGYLIEDADGEHRIKKL